MLAEINSDITQGTLLMCLFFYFLLEIEKLSRHEIALVVQSQKKVREKVR